MTAVSNFSQVRVLAALGLVLAVAVPAPAAPSRDLLPDLVALPTVSLYVGGVQDFYVTNDKEVVYGCQPHEVANDKPTPSRCLRFDTRVANLGAGALELHFHADEIATSRGVTQRLYAKDGSYRDVPAGSYEYDPTHQHFHYYDFAVASLWRSDARARRLDKQPLRTGHKAGFCLEDVYPYRTGPQQKYTGKQSCYPTAVDGTQVSQVNGVSVNWVDVYDLSIPHQYIEVSGVADGYYLLQIAIDPLRRLRETTTKDNVVWQLIRLCAGHADIVGRTHACG